MTRLRVLTWHVHGSYLRYLSHADVDLYLPVRPDRADGYGGRAGSFDWPPNVHEIPVDDLGGHTFDCVLFQARQHWLVDQWEVLSPAQRRLPRIYLEHDPPREHPTDTRHAVDDPDVLVVHVTHFNALMWDCGRSPTTVIEHGVTVPPGVRYDGRLERGIVVVNNIASRGRRLGADVFDHVRRVVPLDLVGMGWQEAGGIGEFSLGDLPAFEAQYRFFFNPIRYTSLGLAVCEAMAVGLPIVGLATTEMTTVVENGVSGYVDTDVQQLIGAMQWLLAEPGEARRLGAGAARVARDRFGIERFARDWERVFASVSGSRSAPAAAVGEPRRR